MSRWIGRLAAVILLFCLGGSTGAAGARSKPGPVDQRGTAVHLGSRAFTLRTGSHGNFHVVMTADTSVTLKGKRARVSEGDHVGVQGFLSGRTLRAIWVHIYSRAAPKPFSARGTVTSVTASRLTVQTGLGPLVVTIDPATPVTVGSAGGTVRDLRRGDRVLVRARRDSSRVTALHIHIYRSTAHLHHVSFRATVVTVAGTAVTVKTASGQKQIQIPDSAAVYLGNTRTSRSGLHAGERVRIYACCAGTPLTATSVHIYRSRPHTVSEILHGTVVRLLPGRMVISVGGRSISVVTPDGTGYQIASAPAPRRDIRPGDQVTVRAHVVGGRTVAFRIDVPAASRAPRSVIGTITSVSPPHVVVASRGRLYTLDLSGTASITLDGKHVPAASLRVGDKVNARGALHGTTLAATAVSAVRPPPVVTTVRGTIMWVQGRSLIIADSAGARHSVHLAQGVHPIAGGSRVPASAVFPGVRAAVKGTVNHSSLLASSLEVSVVPRDVSGRLVQRTAGGLQIKVRGRLEAVDLGGAPTIRDAGQHIAATGLRVGAFLEVEGYSPASYQLRATVIRVLHPVLDITGTLVVDTGGLSVHISGGETYRIHVGGITQVSNARAPVTLTMQDVPSGTRLRVTGQARSDGSIAAATVVVQLSSVTLRGTIASASSGLIVIASGAGRQTVRVDASAAVWQGSQQLQPADLVVGDDLTVEGYAGKNAVLARTLQVHRPLVGLDGVVQATGNAGMTLSSATGTIRVLVGPDTQVRGSIVTGTTVHVTGYRRGDGVILATKVRAGK